MNRELLAAGHTPERAEEIIRADERERANVYWRQEAARWRQARDFTPEDARAELDALRRECDRLQGALARAVGERVRDQAATAQGVLQ